MAQETTLHHTVRSYDDELKALDQTITRMGDLAEAQLQSAIQALNGFQMNGRPLRVNEAQERPQRPRQGGGPFRR